MKAMLAKTTKATWVGLKRGFRSPIVWLGVLAFVVVGLQPIYSDFFHVQDYWARRGNELPFRNSAMNLRLAAADISGMSLWIRFLAVLPLGVAFCDDYKTGYINHALYRAGREGYIAGSGLACIIAGGVVAFAGGVLFDAVIHSVFPPFNPAVQVETALVWVARQMPNGAVEMNPMFSWLAPNYAAGVWVSLVCDFFWMLLGMVYAAISLVVSAVIPNRYVALCSPFLLTFFYDYAVSLLGLYRWQLNSFFVTPIMGHLPIGAAAAILGGIIAVLGGLYYFLARRRLTGKEA